MFLHSEMQNYVNITKARPTVSLHQGSKGVARASSMLLKRNAFCVISIIETNDTQQLGMFVSMASMFDNHNMIYIGKNEPHASILSRINRPLIWISTETKQVIYFVEGSVATIIFDQITWILGRISHV